MTKCGLKPVNCSFFLFSFLCLYITYGSEGPGIRLGLLSNHPSGSDLYGEISLVNVVKAGLRAEIKH